MGVVFFLSQGSFTFTVAGGFPPEVLAAVFRTDFPPEGFWLFSGPLVAATVVLAFAELLSLAFLPLVAATVELWLIAFSSLVAATVELLLVAFLFPPEVLVACLDTTV